METIYSIWKISLCSSLYFLAKQTLHDSWESVLVNTKKRYDVSLDLKDLVTKYETIRVREDFLQALATGNFHTLIEEAKCPRLLRILSKCTFPEVITCNATGEEVASFLLACPRLMQKESSLHILFSKLLNVKMSRLRMSEVYREMVRTTMFEFSFSRYTACPRPEVVSTDPSIPLRFLLSVIDYEINFRGIFYSEVNRGLNKHNAEAISEVVFDEKGPETIAYFGTRREKDFLKKLMRVGYYQWLAKCDLSEKGFERNLTQVLVQFVIAAVPNKKKLFDLPLRNEIRALFMAEYKSKQR